MSADSRTNYDNELERAEMFTPGQMEPQRPRRSKVPKWYKGDGAAASSMLAARQLGLRPAG